MQRLPNWRACSLGADFSAHNMAVRLQDPESSRAILEQMRQLAKELDIEVMMAVHDEVRAEPASSHILDVPAMLLGPDLEPGETLQVHVAKARAPKEPK